MNGWILHKKEMGEVYETDILVEEFEKQKNVLNGKAVPPEKK